jgi:hypothetical protein
VSAQRLAEPCPGLARADRIEGRRQRAESERAEEVEQHLEHLGLRRGTRDAEELHADLGELAVPAGLGPFVAELRADVVETKRHRPGGEAPLDHRPNDARRVLGPHRERAPLPVGERIHLLVDNVRGFADRAREERGVLEHRGPDLAVAPRPERLAGDSLRLVPAVALWREEVARALDRSITRIHRDEAHRPSIRKYSSL